MEGLHGLPLALAGENVPPVVETEDLPVRLLHVVAHALAFDYGAGVEAEDHAHASAELVSLARESVVPDVRMDAH
jgi:hypothetical protein